MNKSKDNRRNSKADDKHPNDTKSDSPGKESKSNKAFHPKMQLRPMSTCEHPFPKRHAGYLCRKYKVPADMYHQVSSRSG